jgi:release factor glutamine methyltransferase
VEAPAVIRPELRPSEYTGALIAALRARAAWARGAAALEIGFGSGVVLAALGGLGAEALCGVDIEAEAVAETTALLAALGLGRRAELHRGDMWQPLRGRRFDLIAANLPHFPMTPAAAVAGPGGRLPSWSSGGADGRLLLDAFLDGLGPHLAAGGRAVLTHNAFVGLDRTRGAVERCGLSLRVASTTMVAIPADKLERMPPCVLRAAERDGTVERYGPHAFGLVHVVEIGAAGSLG